MYKASILSIGLHILIFTIAYNGLPEIKKNIIKEQPVNIVFELPPAKKTSLKTVSPKKNNIQKQIKRSQKQLMKRKYLSSNLSLKKKLLKMTIEKLKNYSQAQNQA